MNASAEARGERSQGGNWATRLSVTFCIGLGLILIGAGWFGGWYWWASTRIWVPVEVPVSLAPGHVRTPEFAINVASTYLIEITLQRELDVKGRRCYPGYGCPFDLSMSWALRKDGRVLARGRGTDGSRIGKFRAGEGRYVLDVDVSQDGSHFNAAEPHLAVIVMGDQPERVDWEGSRARAALLVLGAVGVLMIIRSAILSRQEKQASLIKAYALTQAGPQSPAFRRAAVSGSIRVIHPASEGKYIGDPRPSRARPLSGLSSIALLLIEVLLVLIITFLVLRPITPKGIRIRLLRPGVSAQPSPGIQPLVVRVERDGRLYVNSELVPTERLDSLLRKELNRRPPDWPVYVEGDGDMDWGDVLDVIDRLRGLHAEVVLLTRAP